jgi:hypothetical protein
MDKTSKVFQRKFKKNSKPRLKDLPFRCSNKECPQHYQTVTQAIQQKNGFVGNSTECMCPADSDENKNCGHRIEFYFEEEDRWVKRNFISERTKKGQKFEVVLQNGTSNYYVLEREFPQEDPLDFLNEIDFESEVEPFSGSDSLFNFE